MNKLKIVVLGEIPEDYHPNTHIVLSSNSFSNSEKYIDEISQINNTYSDFELKNENQKSINYYNFLSEKIGKNLNLKHNLNLSEKFWRIFFNSWLISLIQACIEREKVITNFIDKHKNDELQIEILEINDEWYFKDSLDFLKNGISNNLFNEWLYSQILKKQIPSRWKVSYKYINAKRNFSIKKSLNIKSIIKNILDSLSTRSSLVYGFNYFDKFFFSLLLTWKKKVSGVKKVEIKKENINWSFNFEIDIIDKLFFEYTNKLSHINIKKGKKGKLKLISSNDLFYNSNKIIDCAKRVEGGEYLIGTQHGGHTYGSASMAGFLNTVELNKCIEFFSWGWDVFDGTSTKLQPLPSPFLSKFNDKYKCENDKIILIGTSMQLFHRRFESLPTPKEYLNYRNNKFNFISKIKLHNDLYKNFYYRPYFHENSGLNDLTFFKEKIADLLILKGNLHNEILKCKILILDHPGTTLNIAMAANIPILCCWNNDFFRLNKQARKDLLPLKNNNIFFDNFDLLFDHLYSIKDNVSGWWQSKELQHSRLTWCNKYARTSDTWRKEWINQLIRVK